MVCYLPPAACIFSGSFARIAPFNNFGYWIEIPLILSIANSALALLERERSKCASPWMSQGVGQPHRSSGIAQSGR
jgi:hypothetical protein